MMYAIVGIISGIISGMGIGGGTILIPALTLLFDYEQKTAQNLNLIYFIPTAAIALTTHIKNDNVEKKIVKKIIFWGIIGAVVGAVLAINIDSSIMRKLFGGFLLIMGVNEIFSKKK